MTKSGFMNGSRWGRLYAPLLLIPSLAVVQGCTDLDENPTSSITPDNFFQNEEEVLGGIAGVYADLSVDGGLWGYYNLSEISTDEMIVPTRGSDWFDNGRWLEIHRQSWAPNSPVGLDDINRVWIDSYRGISRANVILEALEKVTVANQEVLVAELRTLRAFYYYMLMDMFGGVPIVTDTEITPRERATRAELFAFLEQELMEAREVLPAQWPPEDYARMTKGAADAILASMYLNAGVFTKDDGIDAAGYNSCQGVQVAGGQNACEAAIAAADRILNSGVYALDDDWRGNFAPDNFMSPELILVAAHLPEPGLGLNFVMRSSHYNQFDPSPWNGFAVLAETYRAFDEEDQRRNVILAGPQFKLEEGQRDQPAFNRQGERLVFTVEIDDATQASEGEGTRLYKWPLDPDRSAQDNGNDFAYFRLGGIYLIKAEALLELGRTGEALQLVNTLRARVFDPPQPRTTLDRDAILQERLFELAGEAKRRQDLIRHGKFTMPWAFKDQREAFRVLMPIPQTQIDANPMLVQNPGY